MLTPIRYSELGTMKLGWLDAHYHFSFADYHNPTRMGFGNLRVINDDIVAPNSGFDFHPHRDMEIITYVREGAITHEDSLGNKGITRAGDVQVMSAGTGILHSEHNHETVPTRMYQIWILPREKNVSPRYAQRAFPEQAQGLQLLVSGLPEHAATDALPIYADAALWGGTLAAGSSLAQPLAGAGYLLVSRGEVESGDHVLRAGDALALRKEPMLNVVARVDAELVLIDLPLLNE